MSFNWRGAVTNRTAFLPAYPYAVLTELLYGRRLTTLRNPQRYSEMLVAKNLRDRNPLLPLTADKFEVRDFVADRIGDQYLTPLLHVSDSVDGIDWDALEAPFVMKATHGSGMNYLVGKDDEVDVADLKATAGKWLDQSFYKRHKEWAYKHIKPRVVIEAFLGDGVTPPDDYKLLMFNGSLGVVQVDTDRFTRHTNVFLDAHWNRINAEPKSERTEVCPERPANFDEMVLIAEKLAEGFNFLRVDLYNVGGKIYFGELTHFPAGGTTRFKPDELDLAIGDLWRSGTPIPDRFLTPWEHVAAEQERSAAPSTTT